MPKKTMFKKPRKTWEDKKEKRRFERERRADVRRAKEYIESAGGAEAFERKMHQVAEEHGGTYGLPAFAPDKKMVRGRYFECEAGIRGLKPLGSAVEVELGLLIFPEGIATATIDIPEEFRDSMYVTPHSTSTFARCGVNMGWDQREFTIQLGVNPLPPQMGIFIQNWQKIPILLRENDPCRLLNYPDILSSITTPVNTAPRTRVTNNMLHLHAGYELLITTIEKLAQIIIAGEKIPYIDPHADNIKSLFQPHKFEKILLEPCDFIVISSRERIRVPRNRVVLVHSARDGLIHTSAVLAHPGWEGVLALEFMAFEHLEIMPGDHLANLTTHLLGDERDGYSGRYQGQDSATPLNL